MLHYAAPGGATRAAVTRGRRGPTERAGRAESVRFAATRAIPFLVRSVPGARPAFSAETLRELRARHGGAPVPVRGLSGTVLVLLDPRELRQFYAEQAAEPVGAAGAPAGAGRAAAEPVLCSGGALHSVIAEEARQLAAATTLELVRVRQAVARAARRIVSAERGAVPVPAPFGGPGDRGCAGLLGLLRRRGRAEHAAPAAGHAPAGPTPYADPADPLQPWLRAMDTVPATVLRTLLLLGAHPAEQEAAAAEAAGCAAPEGLARLDACVRESLRLYPAVPDLVRVTRTETEWRGVRYPAGTRVLLPVHFLQRDPAHVPAAHVFVPGRWKTPGAAEDIRMSPFGHGPGSCPGSRLGLLVTAGLCAEVLRRCRITGTRPVLDPPGPLPAVLDPRAIRLTLTRR
ncbi:cytochrome P450 [Streptomyces sp. BR123]|uniref:cytochrome P450 n=1 Tax=Streptomyces sp. BR123 TaxID=2749828 RepID=UPI0015C4A45A|nr:cytochrome P450 [Streptomyces sp. BR123]NXY92958.1 cytochrome P450 [Streptomyces sp. BR123]